MCFSTLGSMQTQELIAPQTRKSDRIAISINVQISSTDLVGERFSEVVRTINISRNGCCLISKRALAPEQRIYLQRMDSTEELTGRVVGQVGVSPEGNLYGIEVFNPDPDFWGIRFPPQKELEEGTVRVLLKCGLCDNCEEVAINEVELSVFQITHRLTRKCKVCSTSSLWEPIPEKAGSLTASLLSPNGRNPEKRKHARINMRTVACIGPPGPRADVVEVINISRGGVCFHSKKNYPEDAWVQVAVPYTEGAANIFVAGRIVRTRRINEKLIEYGVEYVKNLE